MEGSWKVPELAVLGVGDAKEETVEEVDVPIYGRLMEG